MKAPQAPTIPQEPVKEEVANTEEVITVVTEAAAPQEIIEDFCSESYSLRVPSSWSIFAIDETRIRAENTLREVFVGTIESFNEKVLRG